MESDKVLTAGLRRGLKFNAWVKTWVKNLFFYSFIRTFEAMLEGTFVRQSKIKTCFILFCTHLFVPLQHGNEQRLHQRRNIR